MVTADGVWLQQQLEGCQTGCSTRIKWCSQTCMDDLHHASWTAELSAPFPLPCNVWICISFAIGFVLSQRAHKATQLTQLNIARLHVDRSKAGMHLLLLQSRIGQHKDHACSKPN